MLFNSFEFLIFFPIVLIIYFLLKKNKYKRLWLLISSYYFYMCWNPKYILLLLFSTLITYISGLLMDKCSTKNQKKVILILSIIINLLLLGIFKYYNFFITNINSIFNIKINRIDILLPVGISFYVFQALSYSIDVYRKDIEVEKNFVKYALFVSFFPQLVAGPIEKSKDLLNQFNYNHKFNYNTFINGLTIILIGFFEKVVVADRLAIIVNKVYNNLSDYSGIYLIIATFLFAFQIYCDFNSYSLIAKGSSRIMGFELMDNFNNPYFSTSIKEFWNRWHISLSSWFKEYLYFPLGGSRCSFICKLRNICIVFLVSGLWHGASWTFVIWGGLHALYQIIEALFKKIFNKEIFGNHKLIKIIVTFILVDFAWIFFRANNISDALYVISNMFNFSTKFSISLLGVGKYDFVLSFTLVVLLLVYDYLKKHIDLYTLLLKQNYIVRWIIFYIIIFIIIIFGIYGPGFDESQFIYFQF